MDVGGLWEATRLALSDAYGDLIGFAIGLVEALVVAVIAIAGGRFARRRVARGLARTAIDRNVATLAANGVTIVTYVVAVTIVLALLGASWTALGAVLGAGTVAITLAMQDVLRSFVAGVYLLVERPFAIGDRIRVREIEGQVDAIDLRTTALRTAAGERVLVPNATVFAEIVTNRSAAGGERATLTVTGLTAPLVGLPEAVREALVGVAGVGAREPEVRVVAAGSEGVEVAVTVLHEAGTAVGPALVARLRERFPEASVSLADPSAAR